MTAIATPPVHRVHAAVSCVRETLASVVGEQPWSMTTAETAKTLEEVEACEAQLRELKSRLLGPLPPANVSLPHDGAGSTQNSLPDGSV